VRVNQGFFDPVRCFVENDGAVLDAEPLERAAPFTAACGKKSGKKKFLVWQTRSGKSREQR